MRLSNPARKRGQAFSQALAAAKAGEWAEGWGPVVGGRLHPRMPGGLSGRRQTTSRRYQK
jgi:hypothetical protein